MDGLTHSHSIALSVLGTPAQVTDDNANAGSTTYGSFCGWCVNHQKGIVITVGAITSVLAATASGAVFGFLYMDDQYINAGNSTLGDFTIKQQDLTQISWLGLTLSAATSSVVALSVHSILRPC